MDIEVRHPRCVYNKLDWSLYTSLTQEEKINTLTLR